MKASQIAGLAWEIPIEGRAVNITADGGPVVSLAPYRFRLDYPAGGRAVNTQTRMFRVQSRITLRLIAANAIAHGPPRDRSPPFRRYFHDPAPCRPGKRRAPPRVVCSDITLVLKSASERILLRMKPDTPFLAHKTLG